MSHRESQSQVQARIDEFTALLAQDDLSAPARNPRWAREGLNRGQELERLIGFAREALAKALPDNAQYWIQAPITWFKLPIHKNSDLARGVAMHPATGELTFWQKRTLRPSFNRYIVEIRRVDSANASFAGSAGWRQIDGGSEGYQWVAVIATGAEIAQVSSGVTMAYGPSR